MVDGFYWGKFADSLMIEGGKAGVVLVKDGTGFLFGYAFKLSAFEFGDNPNPIVPPEWLINKLKNK